MFEVADLKNARQLHHLGRQLAVLKRIYQSYCLIIERLLHGPQSSGNAKIVPSTSGRPSGLSSRLGIDNQKPALKEAGTAYGVPISLAAAVRFERLADRISLYAMSEIQDCLDEKEALVMLVCHGRTLMLSHTLIQG